MRTTLGKFHYGRWVMSSVLGACLVLSPLDASAQSAKIQITHLEKLADKAAEVVDVTLDGSLLQLASKFMSDKRGKDEAAAKDFIQHLQGIYVKSFEFDKEGEYTQADVEEIRKQLHAPNWQRTVEVRSRRDGENAEIYLMPGSGTGADAIQGLAIICAEPKELTVVNIVGPIDLDKLAELDGKMGIPQMGLERTGKDRKDAKDTRESKDGKESKEATRHDEPK